MRRVVSCLLCVLALAAPAAAHQAPFSFLDLRLTAEAIDGLLVLHVEDVARELGIEDADRLLDPAVATAESARILGLAASRLTLIAGGPLPVEWLDVAPEPDRHAVRLRFRAPGRRPGQIAVGARLFPADPVHQTFVNVYEDDELRHQLVLRAEDEPYVYYSRSTQGTAAVLRTFIPSGIRHILIGPDHILFLIALLLPGGGWKTLLAIVTAFTVGHSITLSLAALNLVSPPARLIEPAIALSIVYAGADNLTRGGGRDVRAWVALLFGLIHGFGFASVLREFGLPQQALGWSLFSFNLGVEIGQLVIVLPAVVVLAVLRRRNTAAAAHVVKIGSIAVIAAGVYWFVERAFL
jgi:hydrogenase/urease accessory protein HupE